MIAPFIPLESTPEWKRGEIGEKVIALLMRLDGWIISPVYEKEIESGKGPRLFMPLGNKNIRLVAPDMLAKRGREVIYIEAKHKSHFTWFVKSGHWQTGIDVRHYRDYLKVRELTQWDVWLYFLHAKDTPPRGKWANGINGCNPQPLNCPTGLFIRELGELQFLVDHEGSYTNEDGRTYPMVYWDYEDLEHIATLEDVHSSLSRVRAMSKGVA